MPNMRDIKRRIKSIQGTSQITKAMNLVSAAKLARAKNKLTGTRPFYEETQRIIARVINSSSEFNHPFIEKREGKNTVIIVISGDRGLCGGYNSNIIKESKKAVEGKDSVSYITIGKKCTDQFTALEKNIVKYYTGISESAEYTDAESVGRIVVDMYKKGEVDEVLLAYTVFESTISHVPKVERILPVDTEKFKGESTASDIMLYEPGEEALIDYLVPKYINTIIFGAMSESAACEQGARMTSMDAATKNAGDAIDRMSILYNRARQGAITQEISEIVGGANALA